MEWINEQIQAAQPGSSLYGLPEVEDPSSDIQLVLIRFIYYFMHQRRPGLTEQDIPEIQEKAVAFIESAKLILPERVGSKTMRGELIGWNFCKLHSLFHTAQHTLMFGYTENYSTQGPECAHKVSSCVFICVQIGRAHV